MDGLTEHGFFRGHSIPYVSMDIRWPSFESYLSALRHNYRRPIKLTLKRRGQSRPEIVMDPSSFFPAEMPKLIVDGKQACSPQAFFELYLQVMDRAKVKLETLNRAFFEHLYANMDVRVLAMIKGEQILGAAILIVDGTTMTFLLVGLDYTKRDEYEIYFNLVYGIISLAIEWGCTKLNLGQTSYWLKQRIGGVCIPEYLYFKANHHLVHSCLRTLRSVIFPETALPVPRVFRGK
jgi:predicted N-acyltransferase